MNAIFFFCFGFKNVLSSALISESSWSARQVAERSRSCWRACLFGMDDSALALLLEGVSSSSDVGNLDVGFWKGIDRKRVDSILADGT